jgi:hypothetical protein
MSPIGNSDLVYCDESSDFSRRNTMEVGSPSRTAILTAIHRAAHFVIDDPPKILAN